MLCLYYIIVELPYESLCVVSIAACCVNRCAWIAVISVVVVVVTGVAIVVVTGVVIGLYKLCQWLLKLPLKLH